MAGMSNAYNFEGTYSVVAKCHLSLDTAVPRWTGVKRENSFFWIRKQQLSGALLVPLFFLVQGWDPPGLPVDIHCRGSISWALGA